jgi:hypothetical protein
MLQPIYQHLQKIHSMLQNQDTCMRVCARELLACWHYTLHKLAKSMRERVVQTCRSSDIKARPSLLHLRTRERPSTRVSASVSTPYSSKSSNICTSVGSYASQIHPYCFWRGRLKIAVEKGISAPPRTFFFTETEDTMVANLMIDEE